MVRHMVRGGDGVVWDGSGLGFRVEWGRMTGVVGVDWLGLVGTESG